MNFDGNVGFVSLFVMCGFLLIYAITVNKKNRQKGETSEVKAKFSLKDGFEISNKISDNIELQNQLVGKCFNVPYQLSSLEGKTDKGILKHYKETNYHDEITRLLIYIEFTSIVNCAIRKIQIKFINYCANNGIAEKSKEDFKKYVDDKIEEIKAIFNTHFSSSEIDSIKQLNIDKVCGYYKLIVKELLKSMYNDIYDNHLQEIESRKKFSKKISQIPKENITKAYIDFITNIKNDTSKRDAEVIEENMENLLNFLLGLFHDNLERGYSEKSK